MLPELLTLGPFKLHSFGFSIALGVFLSLLLMVRYARKWNFLTEEKVFNLVLVAVLSGFAGGRLAYIVQEWRWYLSHPLEVFAIWEGGLIYQGGLVAGFLAYWIYSRVLRISPLEALDFVLPFLALTHAFGRVGCFLNGCCYGKPCDWPWAVKFPFMAAPVHPVQLYEALFNAALFIFLLRVYERRKFNGQVTALYFIGYPAGRFVLEFFRGDQVLILGIFSFQQILSLFLMAGASVFYANRSQRG